MAGLNSLPRLQPPKHTTLQNQLPAVSLALRAVDDAAVLWLPLSPLWFFQGDLTEAKNLNLDKRCGFSIICGMDTFTYTYTQPFVSLILSKEWGPC